MIDSISENRDRVLYIGKYMIPSLRMKPIDLSVFAKKDLTVNNKLRTQNGWVVSKVEKMPDITDNGLYRVFLQKFGEKPRVMLYNGNGTCRVTNRAKANPRDFDLHYGH